MPFKKEELNVSCYSGGINDLFSFLDFILKKKKINFNTIKAFIKENDGNISFVVFSFIELYYRKDFYNKYIPVFNLYNKSGVHIFNLSNFIESSSRYESILNEGIVQGEYISSCVNNGDFLFKGKDIIDLDFDLLEVVENYINYVVDLRRIVSNKYQTPNDLKLLISDLFYFKFYIDSFKIYDYYYYGISKFFLRKINLVGGSRIVNKKSETKKIKLNKEHFFVSLIDEISTNKYKFYNIICIGDILNKETRKVLIKYSESNDIDLFYGVNLCEPININNIKKKSIIIIKESDLNLFGKDLNYPNISFFII